jgi:hypothetical protein
MRNFIDLIESETSQIAPDLEATIKKIANYIHHNSNVDMWAAAEVLRNHGYAETVKNTKFFRVLFHDVSAEDRARYQTVGEMYEGILEDPRWSFERGPSGFSRSLTTAKWFSYGTFHHYYSPEHHMDAPLEGVKSVAIIYEVKADPADILWSMEGLVAFIKDLPKTPAVKAFWDSMDDFDGYGSDDEVVIDVAKVKITRTYLYDSRELD